MVNPQHPALSVRIENWPIAGTFAISRGAKTESRVVVAELSAGGIKGRGECVPYARYGERVEAVAAAVEGADRPYRVRDSTGPACRRRCPPGAARNALDCALWDFEAKRSGRPVHEIAQLPLPRPLTTAFTISLGSPDEMAKAAQAAAARPLLKVKLGGDGDPARIEAVRKAAPRSELIVDANEAWTEQNLGANLAACAQAGVTLVEQPLPAEKDTALATIARPIPVCADESAHDRASLRALVGKYDAVNIKLDKAGGLTEALAMTDEAVKLGFSVMAGCMVATSLAMAPALLFAQRAKWVDLDGPLLLERDREHGLRYDGSLVHPAEPALWG